MYLLYLNLLRTSAEGVSALVLLQTLGEPEVRDLQVPLQVQEHVLRLQVPIHDLVVVQVRHR